MTATHKLDLAQFERTCSDDMAQVDRVFLLAECKRQREQIAKLRAALQNAVAEGYREQWAHPGIGRHDPYLIAAPAWVDKARAALARTEDA